MRKGVIIVRYARIFLTTGLLALLVPISAISQDRLLILAPDEFIDELQPLKRFKECTGRPTTLVGLTQIYNDPAFNGVDEPEEIKRCIAYYEKTGVKFVLLVGDVDKLPGRWRWWGAPDQEHWAVSELYYADLYETGTTIFDDWDVNDNGLYGEIEFAPDGFINNDAIDFLPDVSVGRVPASTPEQVTAYVNKVIKYELKTSPSDVWFRKAALYTGCWFDMNSRSDEVGNSLAKRGIALTKRYASWPDPDPEHCHTPPGMPGAVVGDINGGVGFVNYMGHGNDYCWACLGFCSNSIFAGELTNGDMLPVGFAAACDTGMFARMARFHAYKDVNGQGHCGTDAGESLPPGPYPHVNLPRPHPLQDGGVLCDSQTIAYDRGCMAEHLLFRFGTPPASAGVIAYLGLRTNGQATIPDLDCHFFKAYEQGYDILGEMWKYMLEEYYKQHNLAASHTWSRAPSEWRVGHTLDEPQKVILFGDPSLVVGGAFPIELSGNVYDSLMFVGLVAGYRLKDDVAVPQGQKLTAWPGSRVRFDPGKKLKANDADASKGLVVNASAGQPVCFLSKTTNSQAPEVYHGIKITGQFRLRNGAEIKLD